MSDWPEEDNVVDDEDFPAGPPGPPRPLEDFDAAADAIVRAANKFKRVTGEDGGEAFIAGFDDTMPAYKMPLSAYCLGMAHKLWQETERMAMHREHCEMRVHLQQSRQGVPPSPFGMVGPPGGPLQPMPPDEFVRIMADMAANLSDDQRRELVDMIQAEDTQPGQPPAEVAAT